jgi:putative transposase
MRINEFEQKRLRNRIHGFDYSENGWYMVTICVHNMIMCLGNVENGEMKLNSWGEIAYQHWEIIPNFYDNVEIDKFIIMPNHIHGIIIINNVVTGHCPVTTNNKDINPSKNTIRNVVTGHCPVTTNNDSHYGLISKIVNAYKGIVSKEIHKSGISNFQWQRSFYDHVIRSETELLIKQRYILKNPRKWELDKYNPRRKIMKKTYE